MLRQRRRAGEARGGRGSAGWEEAGAGAAQATMAMQFGEEIPLNNPHRYGFSGRTTSKNSSGHHSECCLGAACLIAPPPPLELTRPYGRRFGYTPLIAAARRSAHAPPGAHAAASAELSTVLLDAGADGLDEAYKGALRKGHARILGVLRRHGAPGDPGSILRTDSNASAWRYHDKLVEAGGYHAFLARHRRVLSQLLQTKFFEAKFGRFAPRDVCDVVASFSSALPRATVYL